MHNKQEYFEYFRNTHKDKNYHSSLNRTFNHTSQYQSTQCHKILPYGAEEYQFRVTNQLLMNRISHPRRDKLIVQSTHNISYNKQSRRKNKLNKSRGKSKQNQLTTQMQSKSQECPKNHKNVKQQVSTNSMGRKNQIQKLYKTFEENNSSCNNYKNDYLLSLENKRMGKLLINVRSMVSDLLTKTYYTYQIYNGKLVNKEKFAKINRNSLKFRNNNKNFGKINSGIKCFFKTTKTTTNNSSVHQTQSEHCSNGNKNQYSLNETMLMQDKTLIKSRFYNQNNQTLSCHAFQTKNPSILQTYGRGNYNLVINRLIIQQNPPIKPQTLLRLEVIFRGDKLAFTLNAYCSDQHNHLQYLKLQLEDEKNCRITSNFTYEYISKASLFNIGLRFRMHRQSQLFIRILRNEGIEQKQIGFFKLNLNSYFSKQKNEFPFKFYKQQKEFQDETKEREIFQSEFEGNLCRLKRGKIDTKVKIQYLFYNSNFRSLEKQKQL